MSNQLYEELSLSDWDQHFQDPPTSYRGVPFWAWNCSLNPEMIREQAGYFQEMGFGGFMVHSRTGLEMPYMKEEFLELVRAAAREAANRNMKLWLYDEDRFPSGFGGGEVTRQERFRQRYLLLTPDWQGKEGLLSAYRVRTDEEGWLQDYQVLPPEEQKEPGEEVWYAYCRTAQPEAWFDGQTYVDTLNSEAIKAFLEKTHEVYFRETGEYFGSVIPAVFTDEPKVKYKKGLTHGRDRRDVVFAWTQDFPETFRKCFGEDILLALPELVWDRKQEFSAIRYEYHRHIMERFTESYTGTIGDWCRRHGLRFTGHLIKEASLGSQTTAVGEVMPPLARMDIPGIDMLCDAREYTTARQAQSVARQLGKEGVVSELYGVTGWDFDFRRHKLAGDWQAAMGVTTRIPHLAWAGMKGEAKRDYPASVFYQSCWYREYKLLETHFARIHMAMTRGTPVVRIGVLHPIESYWLCFGTAAATGGIRDCLEEKFQELTEWLLFGLLDFDYLSETLLAEHGHVKDGRLCVGNMVYEAVVVPGCLSLRESTFKLFLTLQEQGGTMIAAGEETRYLEGRPCRDISLLLSQSLRIPFNRYSILDSLEKYRDVDIRGTDGKRSSEYIYQLRRDGERMWLFIANGRKREHWDTVWSKELRIRIRGEWEPVCYDTLDGGKWDADCQQREGFTQMEVTVYPHDSLLFLLKPLEKNRGEEAPDRRCFLDKQTTLESPAALRDAFRRMEPFPFLPKQVQIRLEEPNVAVLDMPVYALDGEPYQEKEEILRIGEILRGRLGFSSFEKMNLQPWLRPTEKLEHTVKLGFHINTTVELVNLCLAMEESRECRIWVDGEEIQARPSGWYVDSQIDTLPLPGLQKGVHFLEIQRSFGQWTDLEAVYLLGDFNVFVRGHEISLGGPVRETGFGDLTENGLPFYGGAVEYSFPIDWPGGDFAMRVPCYRGIHIKAKIGSMPEQILSFPPYGMLCRGLPPGRYPVSIKLYGHRGNTFGALHNCVEGCNWIGPYAFRTKEDAFCYEYRLKRWGIGKTPQIYTTCIR